MNNEQAEQLLNDLVAGRITPEEFKRLAQRPKYAVIFFGEEGKEQIGQMDPEDTTVVIIDGVRREMTWKDFDAFRKQWPDAEYLPILFMGPAPQEQEPPAHPRPGSPPTGAPSASWWEEDMQPKAGGH